MTLEDKKMVYDECCAQMQSKISMTQDSIRMLQQSANEETKSSAGDKYETGRAMAQLEIEKLLSQMGELSKQKQILDQIAIEKTHQRVQVGSLVKTEQATYFISISLGKIFTGTKEVFCISANAPIGAKLIGLEAGQKFSFQNKEHRILSLV